MFKRSFKVQLGYHDYYMFETLLLAGNYPKKMVVIIGIDQLSASITQYTVVPYKHPKRKWWRLIKFWFFKELIFANIIK